MLRIVLDKGYRIMEIRTLNENEICLKLFASFHRHQEVTQCYRKVDGEWILRDIAFTEEWGTKDYEELVSCLKHTVASKGVVYGAFDENVLIGFCSLEKERFGSHRQYKELSSLHVSWEHRGAGIGKLLFMRAAAAAKEDGAQFLYISSHSAKETQIFYHKMGCQEAAEYKKEAVEKEPCDCQLQFDLKQDNHSRTERESHPHGIHKMHGTTLFDHRVTLREALSIPNLMGYFRILLIPVFCYLYLQDETGKNQYAAAGVILLSTLTDMLDGWAARKFHMVTEFGKLLDPLADKLTQAALVLCLCSRYPLMVLVAILMLVKEGFMAIMGMIKLKKGKKLDGAMWFGKVCTASLFVVLFLLTVFPDMPAMAAETGILFCLVIMLLTLASYAAFFRKM